ncbi:MAG: ABC transporter ATP-binding protein [Planctomycetes bacterium]|nr:ABC transporter ATP-binding protein [Planctomycetota bacterium]
MSQPALPALPVSPPVRGVPGQRLATESRFAFYRSLCRPYWKAFAGMMVLVAGYGALESGRLLIVGVALDAMQLRFTGEAGKFLTRAAEMWGSLGGAPAAQLLQSLQQDRGFFLSFLTVALGVFAPFSFLMAAAFYGKEYFAQLLIVRMEVDVRTALFGHLTRQSVAYFNRQRSGDVISRLTNDVNAVRQSFKLFFETVVQEPIKILFALGLAWIATWEMFVLIVPFYGLLMLPVFRSGKKVIKHGKGRLEKLSLVTDAIQQLFTGIRIVKAFGMEDREVEEFRERNREFTRSTMKMNRAKIKGRSLQELLYNLGTAAAILIGLGFMARFGLTWSEFFLFMGAMVQIYNPLKALSNAWNQLQESRAGADRLLEILREKPLIADQHGSLDFPGVRAEVRFDGVGFSYADLDPSLVRGEDGTLPLPVLHDVSFAMRAGEVVALVGPSGSGKSTIADLLARFYDPQKGAVLVDGVDIRGYRFASFIRSVAIVSQDPFLFNTTIRENIRYGREDATDAEVEEAAKVAFAHEFILEQPEGYETVIGERGVKLSGGQRQRLTIARAVLKDAPILILDEATSSLDSHSEKEVQRAIDNLMRARTTLIIAHRLSTVAHADRILVVEDGRIAESGRHEELLAIRGRYWRLWRSQDTGA